MDKQFFRYLQISYQILDVLVLSTLVVRCKLLFGDRMNAVNVASYYHFLIFLNISWVSIGWISSMYGYGSIASFESFIKKTKKVYVFWVCSVLAYLFFNREMDFSRIFIISSLTSFGIGLFLTRFLYIIIQHLSKRHDQFSKKIVIVGYNDTGKDLIQILEKGAFNKIVGLIENPGNITELTPYPVLGGIENTITLSEKCGANHIYSTVSPEQNSYVYDLMQEAEQKLIRFRIIPDLSHFVNKPVHFEYFDGLPMLSMRSEPLEDLGNRIKKRAIDIVVSMLVDVFVLSWLIPILGLLIYLESPGPIFFSQLRSGRNNRPFRCLKFRSMTVNRDSDNRSATKNDKRITKIGQFLRSTSLDEFPQFWNVLIGEMSLVGPRPHMLKHTDEFSKMVDHYMIRQLLKPGITGWAQINGFRGEVKGHEEIHGRVECDLWYNQNWTPWLDLRILFMTAFNIVKGEDNAY